MKIKYRRLYALTINFLFLLLCLDGCGRPGSGQTQQPVPHKLTFFAMDTAMTVTAYDPGDEPGKDPSSAKDPPTDDTLALARDYTAKLENKLSVNIESSDIYAVNRSNGEEVAIDDETASLIERALEMCEKTGGALDITVYPLTRAWGFTTGVYRVPGEDEITGLLKFTGYNRVRVSQEGPGKPYSIAVDKDMMLDLGAVAKGYAAEAIADILTGNGINSALISLGGNIKAIGHKPDGSDWNVAVLGPDSASYAGILKVSDLSVVTSGGYERYFEENGRHYCHIIDPFTGYPADNGILSVTVTARDSLLCDALSTALFVMGRDKAVEFWQNDPEFDFVIITEGNEILVSEGIYDAFSPDPAYRVTCVKK